MYPYLHIGRAGDLSDTRDRKIYLAFEMMPGVLAWVTLILIIVLSFVAPVFVAVFIILFDVYWFIKTIYLSFHLRISYNKLKENLRVNWLEKLNQLPTGKLDARGFNRIILAGAVPVETDSLGRILIPDYLKDYAGLKKNVVIAGIYNRLEIWDEEKWEAYKKRMEAEVGDMAERLVELGV